MSVRSDILDQDSRESYNDYILEAKQKGEKLLRHVNDPSLDPFLEYIKEIHEDMLNINSIVTTVLAFKTEYKKVLIESVVSICSSDLDYGVKYVDEKIKFVDHYLKIKLFHSIKEAMETAKSNVEFFGPKLIEFNNAIEADDDDLKERIINEIETATNTNTFMENLTFIEKIIVFMDGLGYDYISIELTDHFLTINKYVLQNWIQDFDVKTEMSHKIKAHHLSEEVNAFNEEYDNFIETEQPDDKTRHELEFLKNQLNEKSDSIQALVSTENKDIKMKQVLKKKLENLNDFVVEKIETCYKTMDGLNDLKSI